VELSVARNDKRPFGARGCRHEVECSAIDCPLTP
jgi:hypothetical protein